MKDSLDRSEAVSNKTTNISFSEKMFKEAVKYIPGGVNSPARAFGAVDDFPRFIEKADAQYIYDVDGNKYLDYVGSWGPMILGNNKAEIRNAVLAKVIKGLSFGAATEGEVAMAELMCQMVPSFEKVRMVTSGTEATMSAIRAARGYTGRDKVIKFTGCYHGHHDALLVKAGSGLIREGVTPDSAGVTVGTTKDTLLAEYNNLDSVRYLFDENKGQVAALIVEPVAANMGVVLPEKGFLEGLRKMCTEEGTVLIFDEVITGFRLSDGGAQKLFGITPDMSTFGKIIGGGLPVGAYGGKKEIMDVVAPVGSVYQAGTLAGNPIAVAAGLAQLKYLKNHPKVYKDLEEKGNRLFYGMEKILKKTDKPYTVNHIGSIGSIFFTSRKVKNYEDARTSDLKEFSNYFHHMITHGQYIAPAQFEALFISDAHTMENIDETLKVVENYFGL